jgi:hypothetical protein
MKKITQIYNWEYPLVKAILQLAKDDSTLKKRHSKKPDVIKMNAKIQQDAERFLQSKQLREFGEYLSEQTRRL